MIPRFFSPKSPDDVLPYSWDWSVFLDAGDSLISATVTSSDMSLIVGTTTITGTVVTAIVSGGIDGTSYTLACEIATAAGYVASAVDVLNVLDAAR